MNITTKTILPIAITILFTVGLLVAGSYSKRMGWIVSGNGYLNSQFNYQILLLGITSVSLLFTYLLNASSFTGYFSMGELSARGEELKFFGIRQGDSWMKTGLSLLVVISAVTALFMYFQVKKAPADWTALQSGLGWVLLFALTNSFGEEMIFRMGIVSPLKGALDPIYICWISAILFGLPHFAGMPNGIVGATMAGVLGFTLAKSMVETNGFFWAWVIHFVQDVIIMGALVLMNYSKA